MGKFSAIASVLSVVSAVKSLTQKAPKSSVPQASQAPVAALAADANAAAQRQSALFATEGGAAGEDLTADQVGKRQTIFGN